MKHQNLILLKRRTHSYWQTIQPKVKAIGIRAIFLVLVFLLVSNQEISFHIHIGRPNANLVGNESVVRSTLTPVRAVPASMVEVPRKWWQIIHSEQDDIRDELNLANAATAVGVALTSEQKEQAATYSNLGFVINPSYAKRKGIDPQIVAYKQQKCNSYIKQFRQTAEEEADLYGIPVAITLAQGLLESNVGDSKLAKNDNNHFGIKCKSKCVGCRCANYTDDSKYDMFRVFDTPWYSFREHSKLLNGGRYKHLKKLPRSDYKNWAHGLQAAGYATDKHYAEKLIKIIEVLRLHRFD